MNDTNVFTELDAATAYATVWNRLDSTQFFESLDTDVKFSSQWVFGELEGKASVSDYLTKTIEAVRRGNSPVFAELGKTSTGFPGRDCVALSQGEKEVVSAIMLFSLEGDRIKRWDLCMPELLGVIRSGQYPS